METTIELDCRLLSIRLPADPGEFLNHLGADAPPHLADPYWARLWPTSLTMAALVAKQGWRTNDWALELGCGIGVVGLAALLSGLQVAFSDYVSVAVDVACENARRNGWSQVRGMVFDWQTPPLERFSVILASDVLYDPNVHPIVLHLLDRRPRTILLRSFRGIGQTSRLRDFSTRSNGSKTNDHNGGRILFA